MAAAQSEDPTPPPPPPQLPTPPPEPSAPPRSQPQPIASPLPWPGLGGVSSSQLRSCTALPPPHPLRQRRSDAEETRVQQLNNDGSTPRTKRPAPLSPPVPPRSCSNSSPSSPCGLSAGERSAGSEALPTAPTLREHCTCIHDASLLMFVRGQSVEKSFRCPRHPSLLPNRGPFPPPASPQNPPPPLVPPVVHDLNT